MNNYIRGAMIVGMLMLTVAIGVMAYNAGVSRGLEQSGKILVAPVAAGPYYNWRPWSGGFVIAPFFAVFFWLLVARALFWRGGHWRRCGGGNRFDDWHRHAHERMCNEPGSGAAPKP
jgi:hypothetical protein